MAEYIEKIITKVDCPKCGSPRVKKDGKQNNQQRFECNKCGKKFRNNGKVEGKQFNDEQIGFAIYCYHCGMSLKSIA